MNEHTVGERLRDLRRRAGNPTQKVVAAKVGCGYRSYQNWENGVTKPRWKNALAIARYFDTTPSYILTGVDEDAPTRVELEELDARTRASDAKLDQLLELVQTLVSGTEEDPGDPAALREASRTSRSTVFDMDHLSARREAVS
jgi:transcriptional regulator with XRE-family HTH domain